MNETGIKQINLVDVPHLTTGVKYYDGEIGFADDIGSIINLATTFKVNFVALVFCTSGSATLKINSKEYQIVANDGLLVDMQSVVSDVKVGQDLNCKIICISIDGSGVTMFNKGVFEAFMRVRQQPVVHLNDEEMELMSKYYELALFKLTHFNGLTGNKESMHTILRAFVRDLILTINSHDNAIMPESQMLSQGDKIYQQFVMMLAMGNGAERSVKHYADQLCVSSKYLTSLCQRHEGKTARDLIAQATVGHIKQMLLYSSLSIKEIATKLGFDNLSFFGKYVKKHLGVSPYNYRRNNGYGM